VLNLYTQGFRLSKKMLTDAIKTTFKEAAKKLTGSRKRDFMAKVAEDYLSGSARQAETVFGWNRQSVQLGLHERRTGILCADAYQLRGRPKSEVLLPDLAADIRSLVEPQTQADPKFQTTLIYARISARAVREALIQEKGYAATALPHRQTMGAILNRLGYRLRKTQKTRPLKKRPETNAIFENVFAANQAADEHPRSLRISIDSKAKVKIGNLSRGGKARRAQPLQANDHDSQWEAVLVPFGILNTQTQQLSIYVGQSAETSDFIVDCLMAWWQENQANYPHLDELVIDLDGGPSNRSNRTQFIKRMVEFSRLSGLRLRLIYYPPYHSKYNPIERCWAVLENFWNGTVLDSVFAVVNWAANMTWKGLKPIVHLLETTYEKGVKLSLPELKPFMPFWQRSKTLPQWDVTVVPS
jgi:hypothetical protein